MGCCRLVGIVLASLAAASARAAELQDYARAGELEPLPSGAASLYRCPWRSNVRTVAAYEALQGIGVYYKHIPPWTLIQHTNVMRQMAASGVRRLRLAPHFAIYITPRWKAPKPEELERLRNELRAARAARIRPCVTFVHIPPAGKAGTRELQKWWKRPWNTELLPVGEVGSPEFKTYLDKTYEALLFVLREARAGGFTQPGSYDLEMGQGLWWGAPAIPHPWPSTTLKDLRPGGRFYEFDRALMVRLRKDGFVEPTVWWAQTHHLFEQCSDEEVPPEAAGRLISFYSQGIGVRAGEFQEKAKDTWPVRPPHKFLEGDPPGLVLARPEGWMADFCRHDNLIALIRRSRTPIAIPSLGVVPREIADVEGSPFDGWQLKQRGLGRTLAFWLNQGAPFVLIHSAYEPGRPLAGEMEHSLIPHPIEPEAFRWRDAPGLVTLRAFCDGLAGAKPLGKLAELRFRYRLTPDPVLIPVMGQTGPLRVSDLLALLAFQLDERRFAVAAYVVTPNVAERMKPVRITLEIDKRIAGTPTTLRPYNGVKVKAKVAKRAGDSTTLSFDLYDDVTWLRFAIE